jgi:DNA-binding response OmpR family regulator
MEKPLILLVDDDAMITEPVARALREAGFAVSIAHDGQTGLQIARTGDVSVVVLDVLMPGLDGWGVIRALRAESAVPILMLTALGDEADRVLGLELGADDYLTKPFSTRELLARVRALLRRVELDRSDLGGESHLEVNDLTIDLDTRRAHRAGEELSLRYKEFEILALLMSRAGEVVSRSDLFDEIWGTDWLGDTRTLDVHIRWLREKVEDDPGNPRIIQTVRGVGYRLSTPGNGEQS